uniref:VWFA domain-containing protein n=1 Tax=Electrophorus electricus TaxID=8005 RepID=A0A4W4H2B2_ELEEL
MLEFVQKVIEKFDIDESRDRVSVVQYSRDPEVHFYLNTFSTKEEVLDSVKGIRHRGGRLLNTGSALQYVRDNVLTASAGGRHQRGVPQVLVLLSGSRSSDNVDAPASALKKSGVLIFGVGTRNSSREVQKIVSNPIFAQSIPELSELASSALLSQTSAKTQVHQHIPERDVVFLLDGSDGTRNSFPAMRAFVEKMVERLRVSEGKDRVSVVQFSRDPEAHFYLNTYATKEDVLSTVRSLRHKGGRPLNTGAALQYVRDNVFTDSSGSRRLEGVSQILILLSGGRSFDHVDTPASALKDLGVLTFAIGSRASDSTELQRISYEPNYAVSVSDFNELPNVQEQILTSVESPVLEYDMPRKDVVFLLDGSDGTRKGFPAMLEFVQKVIEKFDIDESRDRVSVVQYSRDPEVHFYLNTFSTKEEVLDSVKGIRHRGGRLLNTGSALQYVRDNVLTASAGGRHQRGVPQVLVLLSGSRSSDNVDAPASALKKSGVLIFGVGTRNSSREVQKIVSNPIFAQSIPELSELAIDMTLFSLLLSLAPEKVPERDVVFLLDGSDGTRNSFPAMRAFVEKMVERLRVSEGKDRVSVVQFSRDPEAHFYLNTYATKEDVLSTVRSLRHKGGRPLNTGAALQYVRDNVFTDSSGSRRLEGVSQILILLSGGRSFDPVDTPASALKDLGVLTFAIGSRASDSTELQRISYEPNYAVSVSDFNELPNVQEQILTSVEAISVPISPTSPTTIVIGKRDVVFLLDGSDGTRNSFPAMRAFVEKMVERLRVSEGKDRVSVVQFSRDPEAHFYLNTYATKEDVLSTVRSLRHKGGRPLNTGAALQYVRDNVFTDSSGSRRLEGVSQILILLSGGRSFDHVDTPASALKDLGVLTFAIGSRASDSTELQRISYEPNYAVSVSDFNELPNVQEQILTSVEAISVPISPTSPTTIVEYDMPRKDVVFLLDGSDDTRKGFPAMLEFVQKVIEKFDIDESRDRVSVVQYSRDPEVHFYLNTFSTKEEVLDSVKGIRHRGGRLLNTGSALQYVRDNVLTASAGGRHQRGVPQVLVLLSGSRSSDNVDAPASALKKSGVLIFGVGTRNSSREVQKIVSNPIFAQSIPELSELASVQQQFFSSLSNLPFEVTPMKPSVIAPEKVPERDVVFLLDGSDGTRNSFPAMRAFVEKMVERLRVSEGKDRVSVVQFSRDPEAHFYLNTYATKEDVLSTVRSLRHKGGRPLNTGAALQYVRDNVFTDSSGSRRLEGVSQILILLSGGRSFDPVDTPASALKDLGVLTFAIGSRASDSTELQRISYEPNYAVSVSDFNELPNVQEQILTSDVVFLLDGSDDTRKGFPAMLEFVQKVIEKFDIDESRDRVSVVQYSRDPEVHFYLNTFSTKEEVLDSVKGIRHRGGRLLNTGSALQYVRDNVLTASAGGRHQRGVPQVLVLLSGSRSSDNVDAPASALKKSGVLIFGVGTRNSSREVQKIVSNPIFAQSIPELSELASVQQQFFSSLSHIPFEVTPMKPSVIGKADSHKYFTNAHKIILEIGQLNVSMLSC